MTWTQTKVRFHYNLMQTVLYTRKADHVIRQTPNDKGMNFVFIADGAQIISSHDTEKC